MKKIILFFYLISCIVTGAEKGSSQSSAPSGPDSPSFELPFYLDFNATYGYSQAARESDTTHKPGLTQLALSATIGILALGPMYIGANLEYQMLNQFTDISESFGNFQGKRTFVAPTIGARLSEWLVKLSIQSSGDYVFSQRSASGASLQYTQPSGIQFMLSYLYWEPFYLGLLYEKVDFSRLVRSDDTATNADKMSLMKVAGVITWVY